MATWDVFRSDRLEIERALSLEAVRAALARGEFQGDDLIRPAGTTDPWARLADLPALAPPPPAAPAPFGGESEEFEDEDEDDTESWEMIAGPRPEIARDEPAHAHARPDDLGRLDLDKADDENRVDLPSIEVVRWDEASDRDTDEFDPLDEDEEAAEFTLSRGDPERVEELDLAAMVDVAFQLVLFFLVTATTVLYKSLEVPKPNPDTPAAGATQGKAQTLDDLKNDYILVEIDPDGIMKIDREPVAATMPALIERLRSARETTGRKAMLLSAAAATPHRNAVLAYDAANEIGLSIAIARPPRS